MKDQLKRTWFVIVNTLVLLVFALLLGCLSYPSITPRPTHTPWPTGIPDPNIDANTILASIYPTPTMTPLPPETWVPPDGKDLVPMVQVPAGPFLMGSTLEQIRMLFAADQTFCEGRPHTSPSLCYDYQLWAEIPQRTIDVPEFYIDQTEVTNAQYRRCVESGNCPDIPEYPPGRIHPSSPVIRYRQYLHDANYNQYPANVMWDGARAYCQWVGKRLPTEAEWEKAARGIDGRAYPWGNTWDQDKANFNYYQQEPVGSYPDDVSPYGALDMAGNAQEWVDGLFSLYSGAEGIIREDILRNWQYDLLKSGTSDDYRVVRGGDSSAYWGDRISARTISFFRATTTQLFGLRCVHSP